MKSINVIADFNSIDNLIGFDYSFLNMASVSGSIFKGLDKNYFFCDGLLSALVIGVLAGKSINRVSFDFTSIASDVLSYCVVNNKSIAFVGGTESEAKAFESKIIDKYESVRVKAYSGYYKAEEENSFLTEILSENYDFLVFGLGAGKQEATMNKFRSLGFKGTAFTCGGFVRQEASVVGREYYPEFYDKYNLRFVYRMINEPHTVKRYFFDYPVNIAKMVYLRVLGHISISALSL